MMTKRSSCSVAKQGKIAHRSPSRGEAETRGSSPQTPGFRLRLYPGYKALTHIHSMGRLRGDVVLHGVFLNNLQVQLGKINDIHRTTVQRVE